MYLHVSIKDFDGVTAQNVKMGKGNILFHLVLPFLDTLDTCFGLWFWFVFVVVVEVLLFWLKFCLVGLFFVLFFVFV